MALGWRGQYLRYRGFFLNMTDLYRKRADLRAFLEVILSLSTIIIFLLFALKPTVLTIISLLKEIKEKEATIGLLDTKIRNLDIAENVFQQNEALIAQTDLAMGTSAMPNVISNQITGLAAKDSIDILSISIAQTYLIGKAPIKKSSSGVKPITDGIGEMPLSLSIRGGYLNLVSFMHDLENLKIPVRVDAFSMNSTPTDTGRVMVVAVSGRVPYISE